MAKSKHVEELEVIEKELQEVSEAIADKGLQEQESLVSPKGQVILNGVKKVESTPGHTTRAFRS